MFLGQRGCPIASRQLIAIRSFHLRFVCPPEYPDGFRFSEALFLFVEVILKIDYFASVVLQQIG